MEKIVIANLKMNLEESDALNYIKEINKKKYNVSLYIAPSNIYLEKFKSDNYHLTSQNVSAYIDGDYTGEVSASQLKSIGADSVIIGHSERRNLFNEDSKIINEKIKISLENDLKVILCIGSLEKNINKEIKFVLSELEKDLKGVSDYSNIILAYEPVYAISKDVAINIDDIKKIYEALKEKYNVKVVYGGSVNEKNINEIINICDGVIIGKMSQNVFNFVKLLDNF